MLEQMWILSRIIPMTYSDSLVCMGATIRATHGSMYFVIHGFIHAQSLQNFAVSAILLAVCINFFP